MENRRMSRELAASHVLAWTTSQSVMVEPSLEEDLETDADEPPDSTLLPMPPHFERAPVRRGSPHQESMLTKALHNPFDSDHAESDYQPRRLGRRRSITSTFSLASTADYTCDTGITTPPRTTSPSPRRTGITFRLSSKATDTKPSTVLDEGLQVAPLAAATPAPEKKRCISFACAAKPLVNDQTLTHAPPTPAKEEVKTQEALKKPTIKFVCAPHPQRDQPSPTQPIRPATPLPTSVTSPLKELFELSPKNLSRRSSVATISKKYLTAQLGDLQSERVRFHEFASDEPQEEDWIREDLTFKPKLTIDDTLKKELAIRKIGKEAEEEAELEEAMQSGEAREDDEEEAGGDEDEEDDNEDEDEDSMDDDEDDNEDEDEDEDLSDSHSVSVWGDDASDGYKTDSEIGFGESDDEDDDDLVLWTTGGLADLSLSGATPVFRRGSVDESSDSSAGSDGNNVARRALKRRDTIRTRDFRPATPDLPDSTDFVCGTLDEDRPLEAAYLERMAARKQNKLVFIPQDIDPSFPTSEPEDEGEELYNKSAHGHEDSEDDMWQLEDLHSERGRIGRAKKAQNSPRRCRSPPPKRRLSPCPKKSRGRNDRNLFDRSSPRRMRSPPPPVLSAKSPLASPVTGADGVAFKSLAFRPGLTFTKSLPKGPVMFPHINKQQPRRSRAGTTTQDTHVRGAIDIVKGLEEKRQRRKEKYYQKYCTRARKEKAQPKRPPPGQGAERMREVGLIMAGKIGQGNYVLSY
ncbi:hypothetical protein GE21DRAFT_4701 [Neurospora crassa]|uniref:Uncharacterized protein n=1 Tax=Neurospora crassa (strain ATCC 24698 / 74-OR23-1A / CBS 708.71 / DSM 1257 / FGSC 987) TaxID=367110 RepID=Q7RYS7_NEUCR|nr:hypothetical protein NCU00382 [Neurospora crassa OR74A]EAA28032.1 hypothetical protein NCU00382 [Neurospora crassa OR74A]KHE87855.1 hypothetical protein GE21DRAFT_4701 [Neurospora crassa]|eukprot:XP_957268.1 hypothetical protein NCU00382 [Neurospora crassa OR74A]